MVYKAVDDSQCIKHFFSRSPQKSSKRPDKTFFLTHRKTKNYRYKKFRYISGYHQEYTPPPFGPFFQKRRGRGYILSFFLEIFWIKYKTFLWYCKKNIPITWNRNEYLSRSLKIHWKSKKYCFFLNFWPKKFRKNLKNMRYPYDFEKKNYLKKWK